MSSMRRVVATGVVGALACAVMAAGLAWACTPQAQFTRFSPASGAPGTQVTVTGDNFSDVAVTIHWGSASGPVIGTAQGPTFTTTVTVPQAPGDVYAIVAVAIGPTTLTSGQAVGSFTMVQPAQPASGSTSASTSGATPSGQAATPNPQSGGRTSATANGAPATATQRGKTAATVSGATSSRPSFPQRRPVASRSTNPQTVTPAAPATAASTPAQAATRSQGTASASTGSNRGRAQSAQASAPATFGAPSAGAATESSATGDMWTGFDPARSGASAQSAGATAPQGDPASSPATLGIVLLALGLLGLAGGAAVAEARRRRGARTPGS